VRPRLPFPRLHAPYIVLDLRGRVKTFPDCFFATEGTEPTERPDRSDNYSEGVKLFAILCV